MTADACPRPFSAASLRLTAAAVLGAALALASVSGHAGHVGDDDELDRSIFIEVGEWEYMSSCATCHSATGKGYGPYLQHLADGEYVVPALPDLTTLSRLNKGKFPAERIREVIDGRAEIKAHGPREMPVWGSEYRRDGHGEEQQRYR